MRKSNYAINPTPEEALRSNRAILPARVIAALEFSGVLVQAVSPHCYWIEDDLRPRFPHLAEKAYEAFQIYEIGREGALAPEGLARLEVLCHEKSGMVRDWAASIAGSLSDNLPGAAQLVERLIHSDRADVAISGLAALHDLESMSLKVNAIRTGLFHRSKKVRELAASKAVQFKLTSLVSELEVSLTRERNEKFRKELKYYIGLLRDGVFVEELENGAIYITVAGPRAFTGRTYSKEMVDERGLGTLISEIQSCAKF